MPDILTRRVKISGTNGERISAVATQVSFLGDDEVEETYLEILADKGVAVVTTQIKLEDGTIYSTHTETHTLLEK